LVEVPCVLPTGLMAKLKPPAEGFWVDSLEGLDKYKNT